MATIEELEQRSEDLFAAEGAALIGLVAVMRDQAVGLPDGSRLALELANSAKQLERLAAAQARQGMDLTTASVRVMANEVRQQQLEDWGMRDGGGE